MLLSIAKFLPLLSQAVLTRVSKAIAQQLGNKLFNTLNEMPFPHPIDALSFYDPDAKIWKRMGQVHFFFESRIKRRYLLLLLQRAALPI